MKKYIVLIFLSLFTISSSMAQTDEYKTTLRKMFKVMGSEESFQMVITQMIKNMRTTRTNIPDEFWDELEKELINTSLQELTDKLVPAYYKYMDLEDLEALIEFYKSPTGQKFARKTPLIMQESMLIGQEWGKEIGLKVYEKIKEKGY